MIVKKVNLKYETVKDGQGVKLYAYVEVDGETLPVAMVAAHLVADQKSLDEFREMCASIVHRYLKTLTKLPIIVMKSEECN